MEDLPENPTEVSDLLDSLDLTESVDRYRTVGAMHKEFYIEYERDLTEADLAALELPRPQAPYLLQRIHASHHALARCIATGMKTSQAALITGYSHIRIMQLEKDPTFLALVEDYRGEAKSIIADMTERMTNISLDALELLQERMQANPGEMTVPVLLDIVKTFADRTGHGPNSEVHLRMSADLIDRPPRETAEEWNARRAKELAGDAVEVKKLN